MTTRAIVEADRDPDFLATAARALREGAREVVIVTEGAPLAEPTVLRGLLALSRVRVRVSIATFDPELHARLGGRAHPRDVVRGLARASAAGIHVDAILPMARELGPPAGRLHGLARAAPRIARYALVPLPDDLEPLSPEEIAEQTAEAMRAAEELSVAVGVDDETRVDTELESVLAGIKPVMRLSTEAGDEAAFLARYEKFGLFACAGDGVFIHEDGTHSRRMRLVYVAKSLAVAERVRAIEAKTFVPYTDLAVRAGEYRDLGVALGYPTCCVERYVARVILDPESEMGGKELTEPWVVARGGFDPEPAWELNHFLFESGGALIPFTPCGYRCGAALAYASRVRAHVRAISRLAEERMRKRLAVDLVVDRRGARVVVEIAEGRIVSAVPRRTPTGAYVHEGDLELAARIVGSTLRSDGRLESDDPYPPIALRFRRPATDAARAEP